MGQDQSNSESPALQRGDSRLARTARRILRLPGVFQAASLLTSARIRVYGDSMRPLLPDGHRLLVSRLAYDRSPPQRGDLVVLRDPIQPDMRYIKRIVGLPGEHVQMDGGNVAIDGETLVEPYAQGSESVASPFPSQWVPDEAEFFVLGDRRQDSRDSRTFGPVERRNIIGKIWVRYWPPRALGRPS